MRGAWSGVMVLAVMAAAMAAAPVETKREVLERLETKLDAVAERLAAIDAKLGAGQQTASIPELQEALRAKAAVEWRANFGSKSPLIMLHRQLDGSWGKEPVPPERCPHAYDYREKLVGEPGYRCAVCGKRLTYAEAFKGVEDPPIPAAD